MSKGVETDSGAAAEHAGQLETWVKDVDYKIGTIHAYDGVLYRCVQPHTLQYGWERCMEESVE